MAARPENAYISPFSARYVSPEMSALFSPRFKAIVFRRLWIALAKEQQKLGLPISDRQIEQLQSHAETIDFDAILRHEKKCKHDVMAHIHAFGDQCPDAKGIIHLGATSTFATDNADLIQMKEALQLLFDKLLHVLRQLAAFAAKYASAPCLGYTHFQGAQPTTIGKRACLWLQDFLFDAIEWQRQISTLPFLGVKGATGTQASFLALFDNNLSKVQQLEQQIARAFGFSNVLAISGQTYSRKLDFSILSALASFAASAHKMATDIRLLSHEKELEEAFGEHQVGSSAMPYKRNPIYSERICGIARFVLSLSQNGAYTAATQWLERTLDDSSNRRLSIPEAFLGTDAILNLLAHLIPHFAVHADTALSHLNAQIPLLAMENILMLAVKKGADRQQAHEKLRKTALSNPTPSAMAAIAATLHLSPAEIAPLLDPAALIGAAPAQVHSFLAHEVEPFLNRHPSGSAPFPPIEI